MDNGNMGRTNYVVAAWTGARRGDPELDGSIYLHHHLKALEAYEHELSQITVVAPRNPHETSRVAEMLENLDGARIQHASVTLLRRENTGLSYGSFSYAYERFRGAFEYYIFVEDDYVFVRNHFDRILIDMFAQRPGCGFLCQLVRPYHGLPIAAISNGITRRDILAKVWERFGELPHVAHSGHRYDDNQQVGFGRAFEDVGYALEDFSDVFRSPFFHWRKRTIVEFAAQNEAHLIAPIQMVVPQSELRCVDKGDSNGGTI